MGHRNYAHVSLPDMSTILPVQQNLARVNAYNPEHSNCLKGSMKQLSKL